jgi:hypothetical protein
MIEGKKGFYPEIRDEIDANPQEQRRRLVHAGNGRKRLERPLELGVSRRRKGTLESRDVVAKCRRRTLGEHLSILDTEYPRGCLSNTWGDNGHPVA